MNRRAFLAALGAAATQQKLQPFTLNDVTDDAPSITTARFPYVQNVRNDRASILWATYEPGIGTVQYSADGVNFTQVVAKSRPFSPNETQLPSGFVQYQADLTGLNPNTDYTYRVVVDGADVPLAGAPRFRTAGPGGFRFLVMGDSGYGEQLGSGQGLV